MAKKTKKEMTVTEFASLGGKAVLKKRGKKYFSELGRRSQEKQRNKKKDK